MCTLAEWVLDIIQHFNWENFGQIAGHTVVHPAALQDAARTVRPIQQAEPGTDFQHARGLSIDNAHAVG